MSDLHEEPVLIQYTKVRPSVASKDGDDSSEPEGQLTCDVYQTDDEIVVQSAIAGVDHDDLDIHITSDTVSIKGTRYQPEEVEAPNYFTQECFWGTFSRSIVLPQAVSSDEANASLKNGILTIRIPKAGKEKKVKKLKIKLGE